MSLCGCALQPCRFSGDRTMGAVVAAQSHKDRTVGAVGTVGAVEAVAAAQLTAQHCEQVPDRLQAKTRACSHKNNSEVMDVFCFKICCMR